MSRPVLRVLGLTLLCGAVASCTAGPAAPEAFADWSPEALTASSAAGRPLLIDAYADW